MSGSDLPGLGSLCALPTEILRIVIENTLPPSINVLHPSSGFGCIPGGRQKQDYLAILRTSRVLNERAFDFIYANTFFQYVVSAACRHTKRPPRAVADKFLNIEFSINLHGQSKDGDGSFKNFDNDATRALEPLTNVEKARKRLRIHIYDCHQGDVTAFITQSSFFQLLRKAVNFETVEIAIGYPVYPPFSRWCPSSVFRKMANDTQKVLQEPLGNAVIEVVPTPEDVDLWAKRWVDRRVTFRPRQHLNMLNEKSLDLLEEAYQANLVSEACI